MIVLQIASIQKTTLVGISMACNISIMMELNNNDTWNYIILRTVALRPNPLLHNGNVTFTGTSVGDTATYSCVSDEFTLIGTVEATCTKIDNGNAEFLPIGRICRRKFSNEPYVHTYVAQSEYL